MKLTLKSFDVFSSWVGEVMKEEQCNVGWIAMLAFGFLAPCVIIQEMYITPFKELDLTIMNVKITDGKTVQLQFVEKFSCQDLFSPENLQRSWFNILCLLNRPISTHIIRRQRYLSPTNSYFFQKSSQNLIQRNRPISTTIIIPRQRHFSPTDDRTVLHHLFLFSCGRR